MTPYPIGKLMSYIQRMNQKELACILKQYGVGGGGHHSYLIAIIENPGVNQDHLTNLVKFDKATTARCVKQLEEGGFVERIVDEKDRRSYRLYPTEKALQFQPTLQMILDQLNRKLTSCLTDSEIRQLSPLLQKIYDSKQV